MSGFDYEPLNEPDSPESTINLLPSKCRPCGFAQMTIGLLACFASSTGGPAWTISDIENRCSGYQGEIEPDNFGTVDIAEDGLFFVAGGDVPTAACPYYNLLGE